VSNVKGLLPESSNPPLKLDDGTFSVMPGGTLIIANLDPHGLNRLDRVRCLIRTVYHVVTGYRIKPPKGLGKNMVTEQQLCDLLERSGFKVFSTETIRDTSHSSNVPIEYIRAVKV